MRVALQIPGDDDVPALAARAEALGFDLVASGEHVLFGSPTANAFVTLAAAAAATERVGLLSAVTLLPLYPGALAAKMAATLDRVSGGRFELGVGVGGEYPAEFAACGVPVRERGRRTDAGLDVLTRLLGGGPVEGAALDPPPTRPVPIWVGGRSEASARRAGRYGDVWMPYLGSPDRLARGLAAAGEEAQRHGRPAPAGAYFAWSAAGASTEDARATALDGLGAIYGQDMSRILDACVPHGTPEQVAERLAEYRDAGASSVVLAPACRPERRDAVIERFAEVAAALRGA